MLSYPRQVGVENLETPAGGKKKKGFFMFSLWNLLESVTGGCAEKGWVELKVSQGG